jgi:hypothetical protein
VFSMESFKNPFVYCSCIALIAFFVGLVAAAGITRETLTLGAAVLTAVVGFGSYGWQKMVDRSNETQAERRLAYREYLIVTAKLETCIFTPKDTVEVWRDHEAAMNCVQILAPDKILPVIDRHDQALMELQDIIKAGDKPSIEQAVRSEQEVRTELLNAMRDDNFTNTDNAKIATASVNLTTTINIKVTE